MEEKEVFNSSEEFLIGQVCNILKSNNINYIRRNEGAGDYLNKVWGINLGVKRIFVSSYDYEKAMELVEMFNQNIEEYIPDELENINGEEEQEIQKDIKKYRRWRTIFLLLMPVGFTLIVFLSIIIATKILS